MKWDVLDVEIVRYEMVQLCYLFNEPTKKKCRKQEKPFLLFVLQYDLHLACPLTVMLMMGVYLQCASVT